MALPSAPAAAAQGPSSAPKQRITPSPRLLYPDSMGTVWLRARILGDENLEISVKDKGRGIEDLKQAMEPLFTTGGEDRSGMGFTIMDSFMDKMRVRSKPGKGTTVTMTRHIRRKK